LPLSPAEYASLVSAASSKPSTSLPNLDSLFASLRCAASKGFSSARPTAVVVDESKEASTVLLCFASKHVEAWFNHDHTVMDIYQHVQHLQKHSGPFRLVHGTPPKLLTDPSLTIQQAGLSGAKIACMFDPL